MTRVRTGHERHYSNIFGLPSRQTSINLSHADDLTKPPIIDLKHKSHVDVFHGGKLFSAHETCQHSQIARNWPDSRKRFTAIIACLNTACIGFILGVYAGEVPAIQYAIADFWHFTILGNVLMYAGLAISTFVLWPLPLLHGRKPYMVLGGLLALVLQVPQGLSVAGWRDPSDPTYKCLLLVPRAVSGLFLGLSDMNLKALLLDCFGASLQSQNSDKDPLDIYDVRKHGGGIGMWLAFIAWSSIGPISIGFMVGTSIVDRGVTVTWGFWISVIALTIVLLLNVIMPEVRRSAYRRTIAELSGETGEFSRVTRGEVKMHLSSKGPYWWGEEILAGLKLSIKVAFQPGFLILAVYAGWVYAQYNLVLMVSLMLIQALLTATADGCIGIKVVQVQTFLGWVMRVDSCIGRRHCCTI